MSKFTVEDYYEDGIIRIKEEISSRCSIILLLEDKLKKIRDLEIKI